MSLSNLYPVLLVCISSFIMTSFGAKMKDRFNFDTRVSRPFSMAVPINTFHKTGITPAEMVSDKFLSQYINVEEYKIYLAGLNISLIPENLTTFGSADKFGIYDGLIGVIQRNESDTSNIMIRYDDVFIQPGRLITLSTSDSPIIYSGFMIKGSQTSGENILYFVNNYSSDIWFYFLIAIIIITIIYIIAHSILKNAIRSKKRKKFKIRRLCRQAINLCWRYFTLVTNHELAVDKSFQTLNIIWLSIVLGCFIGIHEILCNTLSADFVISSPSRTIETFDDLIYDIRFKNITPLIIKNFNMLKIFQKSIKGSKTFDLGEIIKTRGFIPDRDPETMADFSFLTSSVANGSMAFIESSVYLDSSSDITCMMYEKELDSIYLSKDTISPSPQAMVVSYSTNEQTFQLFEHRMKMISESGIAFGFHKVKIPKIGEKYLSKSQTISTMQCADRLRREKILVDKSENSNFVVLKLTSFYDLSMTIATVLCVATLALVLEHFEIYLGQKLM